MMIYEGSPEIVDLIEWWENELSSASPEELPTVLDNLMAERFQYNPETTNAMEALHAKYAEKTAAAA
jgi:hypothetical protein